MLKTFGFWVLFSCQLAVSSVSADEASCLSKDQVDADLQQLYETLKVSHFDLYAHVSQSEYDAWFNHIKQQVTDCLSHFHTTLLLQKLVAYGRVAHAKIELPVQAYVKHREQGGKVFPLSVKSDGLKLWVAEQLNDHEVLKPGVEIRSLNGIPIEHLLPRLRHLLSADTNLMFGGLLEFYLEFLLWLELGEVDEYALVIGTANPVPVSIQALTAEQLEARRSTQPQSLVLGWEREARMLSKQVAYLRPGPFFNTAESASDPWDNTAFKAFIDEAFSGFKESKPEALLIDLRDNPGGDNSFSDLMLQWIAERPFRFASAFKVRVSQAFRESNELRLKAQSTDGVDESSASYRYQQAYRNRKNGEVFDFDIPWVQPKEQGIKTRVYMLVNRHSYSNAVTVAAMSQDFGFATILGEETTDLAVTYGAMEHFKLTHSGIQVGFPKAFIIRPSGERTVRGVVPDEIIKTPVVESTDDPVLKAAIEHINANLSDLD